MKIPSLALAAIFPTPVAVGPYTLNPPTLLHLAAIDRLGCRLEGRSPGADACATAGFVLSQTAPELFRLMALPREAFADEASAWAAAQTAADLPDLRAAVITAINAAYETAVPGGGADPTPGHPPISDGP